MSESDDWGLAPPPFQPDQALAGLRRSLRELGLTERAGVWEQRGSAIARTAVDGPALTAAVVRKPSRNSPQWQTRTLKNSADVRDFVADLKRRLAGWSDRDD